LRNRPRIPEGLTEAAKEAGALFIETRDAFLKRARESVALRVLVWGKNPKSKSPVAKKRTEIRQELRTLGHYAVFSEEVAVEVPYVSLKMDELAQGHSVDAIISLIEDSEGALGEVHDFGVYPEVARKLLVLVPISYRKPSYNIGGILQELAVLGTLHWYKPSDLESCNVLHTAVQHVETLRFIKFCQRQ
jgi:hypothetical protein